VRVPQDGATFSPEPEAEMLSYQHIYHAGNLADLHKHGLIAHMLDYMTRKDKPMSYLETHAGRGLYQLDAIEAIKTGEAAQGMSKLAKFYPPEHPYTKVVAKTRAEHGASAYPGSPLIAANILRMTDTIHLCDLHPQEFAALRDAMKPYGGIFHQKDGLEMALALTPPSPRRGMMVIDPSYEMKSDYTVIPRRLFQIWRKWNVGTVALWYPVLASGAEREMVKVLKECFPIGLSSEVRFPPAREGHGMIGSGMFILNAPYGTEEEARRIEGHFRKL
jgi:23S rRNA (adenine2030-N6)-methyltransferase